MNINLTIEGKYKRVSSVGQKVRNNLNLNQFKIA